jgi:hypothetical protein
MSDRADPEKYRYRAEEWRKRASVLPEGEQRRIYLDLAEGYDRLVELMELRSGVDRTKSEGGADPSGEGPASRRRS